MTIIAGLPIWASATAHEAWDLMEPVIYQVPTDMPLTTALDQAKHQDLSFVPVIRAGEEIGFQGILDVRAVHRQVAAELLDRQRQADMAGAVA
ncbi:hypothetical protein ACFL6U_01310 [Planctomycetota bacterium]